MPRFKRRGVIARHTTRGRRREEWRRVAPWATVVAPWLNRSEIRPGEAIFELQLKPTAGWDWTVAGLLYERFKDEFSERGQALAVALPGLPRTSP